MGMVMIYYRLVKAGKRTLDEVPEKYREEVRKMLEEDSNKSTSENGAEE